MREESSQYRKHDYYSTRPNDLRPSKDLGDLDIAKGEETVMVLMIVKWPASPSLPRLEQE